jgi:hypothetical protein
LFGGHSLASSTAICAALLFTEVLAVNENPIAPPDVLLILSHAWILAGTEIATWLIAVITARATGLTMFYFKGTAWGLIRTT